MQVLFMVIAASVASAAPAPAPAPGPIAADKLAAAERFLDSVHYDDLVQRTLESVMAESQRALEARLKAEFGNAMPAQMVSKVSTIARRHIDTAIKGNRSALRRGTATIYAKHFTVAELNRLTEMQADPVMEKYLVELPRISAESMALSRAAMEREQESMADEIKALFDDYARTKEGSPST
jgi:hypothetical protein